MNLKTDHIYYVEWETAEGQCVQQPVKDLFRVIKIWRDDKIPYEYYCKPLASNYSLGWGTIDASVLKSEKIKLQEVSLMDMPLFIGLDHKDCEFMKLLKGILDQSLVSGLINVHKSALGDVIEPHLLGILTKYG